MTRVIHNSSDGSTWTSTRITSTSLTGAFNTVSYDPMLQNTNGDNIAVVSDGTHQYFAWTDTRDTVKNWRYPNGRQDADIYAAKH